MELPTLLTRSQMLELTTILFKQISLPWSSFLYLSSVVS
jgi:hypothetical protein